MKNFITGILSIIVLAIILAFPASVIYNAYVPEFNLSKFLWCDVVAFISVMIIAKIILESE